MDYCNKFSLVLVMLKFSKRLKRWIFQRPPKEQHIFAKFITANLNGSTRASISQDALKLTGIKIVFRKGLRNEYVQTEYFFERILSTIQC